MNAKLLQLIIDSLMAVAGSQEDSDEIQELKARLAENEAELADAIQALQEVDRPDADRSDDDIRAALGSLGAGGGD